MDMEQRIVVLRTLVRAILAMLTIGGLAFALWLLLTELNDPNPNAALTALLGSITAAMGQALLILVGSIASNQSDRTGSG